MWSFIIPCPFLFTFSPTVTSNFILLFTKKTFLGGKKSFTNVVDTCTAVYITQCLVKAEGLSLRTTKLITISKHVCNFEFFGWSYNYLRLHFVAAVTSGRQKNPHITLIILIDMWARSAKKLPHIQPENTSFATVEIHLYQNIFEIMIVLRDECSKYHSSRFSLTRF